jgi:hypothetical protein
MLAGVQAVANFLRRSDYRAFEPRSSPRESNPRLRRIRRSNRHLRHRPFFSVLDESIARENSGRGTNATVLLSVLTV